LIRGGFLVGIIGKQLGRGKAWGHASAAAAKIPDQAAIAAAALWCAWIGRRCIAAAGRKYRTSASAWRSAAAGNTAYPHHSDHPAAGF
jgi:hypothetical protein